MANITEKVVDGVVYTYDQEAKNPLGLRTKKLAWAGKLVYDVNKKAPNVPEDDGEEPSPGPSVAKPTFSPSAGNIDKNASVTISCSTSGAEIYYTTNGSEPSKSSTKYTSAITITADITIKAIAYATIEGEEYASSVATAAYVVVMPTVATPTFSPAAGNIEKGSEVTINCSTTGATIHYTTDGSAPTESSPVYSGAIAINSTTTIKAIAIKEDYKNSAVATASYTVVLPTVATPTFSPNGGSVAAGTEVTIACTTDGAEIHYTTDGSAPTSSSPVYSSPIAINSAITLKAIAIKEGYNNSGVKSANFTVALYAYAGAYNNPEETDDASDFRPTTEDIDLQWLENLAMVDKFVATKKEYGGMGDEKPFPGIDEDDPGYGGRAVWAYPASFGDITSYIQNSSTQAITNSFTKLTPVINGVNYNVYVLSDWVADKNLKYAFV